ncbi:methylglyoxal reductase (NADPH-dependent) gre2 [Tulasnella sp. 403]|nr:methylglyoxal reductase (NADPH-dependent) gre2 [Tulasnella sp. 403]
MPVVSAPSKVLVTGASGYLGAHVCKTLVDRGFNVVGAVRSASKAAYLQKTLGDNFEYVIVEDMELPEAYNNAVKGVDAVIHTASVVKMVTGNPDAIIKPAVAGTIGILKSIQEHGPSVKRIIITSSLSAIGAGLTESDWNQAVVDYVTAHGANARPDAKYAASKALAERATWDFVEENQGKLGFDVVTVCPSWIWGPMIHEGTDASSINGSIKYMLSAVHPDHAKTGESLTSKDDHYIDVRDAADIHVALLSAADAGNQRFIAAAGPYTWQDIYDALNDAPAYPNVPAGVPGATKDKQLQTASSEKLLKVLAKSHDELYRPFRMTVRETMESALSRNWVFTGEY